MGDFRYSSVGINMNSRKVGVPPGWHEFRILKADATKSRKGHPMVKLECEVINDIDLMGKRVTHYITFLPTDNKGAGIAIHFLKSIEQPHEGEFEITTSDWIGKEFRGLTEDQSFTSDKDGKSYTNSKIVEVKEKLPF